MSGSAKVESIEPLKALRRTMFKFAEAANSALTDAESDLARTLMWVTMEQTSFWQMQIRKRTEMISKCAEALRMKQLFKDSTGRTSSAIDEQKALEAAKRALEVAHLKAANCKSWSRRLEREVQNYRGGVQRFASAVQADLPVAAAKLSSAIITLEQYVSLRSPNELGSTSLSASDASTDSTTGEGAPSMARPAADEPDREATEEKKDQ